MERRTCTASRPRLVRDATSGKPRKIEGYAAVYYNPADPGSEYELASFGGFRMVERLMPGCFDRAVREDDVRALFNHDTNLILGRTGAGTCRLFVDAKGLRYEITPPDTTYAADLLACLQRGDVSGSSFSFDYLDRSERDIRGSNGMETSVLEVRDVKLYDVGPVTFPAYTSTTSEARKAAGIKWTPAMRLARVAEVEAEVSRLCRRPSPKALRRQRATARLAEVEGDMANFHLAELDRQVSDARRRAGRAG